jgi:hypothetical protein
MNGPRKQHREFKQKRRKGKSLAVVRSSHTKHSSFIMFADLIEKYKSFFVSTIEIIPDWIERARLDAPHKGFVQVKL